MFEFPFNVEIWGTVSDWAMVVITAATGLLLYLTLRAQLNLTKIERYKYKLLVKPELKADVRLMLISTKNGKRSASVNIDLEVKEHKCLIEKITITENNNTKDWQILPESYIEVGDAIHKLLIINPLVDEDINSTFISSTYIEAIIIDVEKRKYFQEFNIVIYGNELKIYSYPSQEIEIKNH